MFQQYLLIKSITIPASIENIYENFSDLENLEKIIFKGTCSKISPSIFANCKNLKEIQGNEILLKDGLIIENKTKIAGFTRPNEILRIPEGITEIKNGAFFFSFIKEIILPKSIEKIGDNAFYNCKRLKKITIPETIKEIGINIFLNCFSLEEIVNSHYFIKNNCIIHDGNLEYCFLSKNKIYIPDGTKYLNTRYLRYYHHTDEFDILLILPEGLKKLYIRNNFIDKINMKIKNVPESLTYVSTDSFDYLKSIFNNENLKKISKFMKLQEINKAILKSFIEESLKDEIFKDYKIQASEEAIKIYKNSQYIIYRYEDFDLQMINFDDFKKTLLNDLSKS